MLNPIEEVEELFSLMVTSSNFLLFFQGIDPSFYGLGLAILFSAN